MQETKIPNHLLELLTSPTLYAGVIKVGEVFNLHIDQVDELTSEIKLYLLGRTSAENFLPNIVERLEIEEDEAKKIIERVNLDILEPLKKEMMSPTNTHLETPDEILKHIEDGGLELPAPEQPVPAPVPTPTPEPTPAPEKTEPQSENLTEHLLNNAVISPKVEKKYTVDPYREPIE